MADPPDHVAEPQVAYDTGPKPATYQDVLDAPAHRIAEVLDGELYLGPRPAPPHLRCTSALGSDLMGPFDRKAGGQGEGAPPGGWWILDEPELHLGPQILVPDLAGWRRERMPRFPTTPWFELTPDWVCEVVSLSTARIDRARKMPIYALAGVQHLWLLDPLARLLEVFELHAGLWLQVQVFAGNASVRARPFDAVELEMERWWLPEPEDG